MGKDQEGNLLFNKLTSAKKIVLTVIYLVREHGPKILLGENKNIQSCRG